MIVGQGYQIKIQDATNLIVVGDYMFPEENPIYLIEGWNLVAYLRLENASVEAVFETLNSNGNLIVVKDDVEGTFSNFSFEKNSFLSK